MDQCIYSVNTCGGFLAGARATFYTTGTTGDPKGVQPAGLLARSGTLCDDVRHGHIYVCRVRGGAPLDAPQLAAFPYTLLPQHLSVAIGIEPPRVGPYDFHTDAYGEEQLDVSRDEFEEMRRALG